MAEESTSDGREGFLRSIADAIWRRKRALAPVAVLLLLCAVIAVLNQRFLDPWNLVRLLNSASVLIVLTMGATFIIILGSIDLSLEGSRNR